jgi:2,5-diamino-6-(ribosylamino)-4(3H)-pyrimidinone 5'-phosphate reductase
MEKPYIICHMMMSVDGRIACSMTAQLAGQDEYYSTLDSLNAPTRISGRVTAATEMTSGETFTPKTVTPYGQEGFAKHADTTEYNIVMDTKGTLLWENDQGAQKPHLIIMSQQVTKDYLDYLDGQGISWIVTGKNQIDLAKAMEILVTEFNVHRLAVVGGGKINGGFLEAGLIDEISILIGPGADGRSTEPSLFDGRPADRKPLPLRLKSAKTYDDGAVWLRYLTK